MTDNIWEIIPQLAVPRYAPRIKPTPIPTAAWNDEPLFCLQVNDEWVSHILGALTVLDQPDTWQGTDDEIRAAREQVNQLMLAFMERCMDCCGQPEIPLTRIDENGHYQQSDDGGLTWHDAPSFDPRNSIPRFPPYPPTSTDNAKCLYADSIVQHFKTKFVDLIEEGATVETLLGILTGIAEAVFGPLTGPIGWIVPALIAIPTAILAAGIADFEAAMTDTVWNKLRCLIVCHMQADGSISQANLDAIYSGIDDVSPDNIVRIVFRSWFAALGTTGMTNAAHLGMGEVGADCSGCDCVACTPDLWGGYIWIDGVRSAGAVEVTRDSNSITLQSYDRGDGQQVLYFSSTTGDKCCCVQPEFVGTPPGSTLHFYNACPGPANYNTLVQDDVGSGTRDGVMWAYQMSAGGPWTIKFTFVDTCD